MDAAFTRLERHERGIHAVSAEPDRAAGRDRESREHSGNARVSGVAGLAMLVWLKEEPGEPADADADALSQGEPALVAADG